jgi:acetyl-CoA acetyltransferase
LIHTLQREPVIAGIGLSDYGRCPDVSRRQHHALAARRALDDAGLDICDVDGYMCADERIPDMAEFLGIDYRYMSATWTGGSSFEYFLQHGTAALRAGHAETILITYGSDQLSRMGRSLGTSGQITAKDEPTWGQFESQYGLTTVGSYAMMAQRHMYEYGTTSEQLARVAVQARSYAALNPKAMYRDPLTIADVVNSRLIADPLHKFDCCVVSDGGGALVLTTRERAADLKSIPIHILGSGTAQTHWNPSQIPDYTSSGAVAAGATAFAEAGLTPADVDMAMLYDSFTITVMVLLEGLGFCGRGESGPFVEAGNIGPKGTLPINTDGGGLSACHPGLRGIFLLVEAVRQLRGEAGDVQVPDCELALAAGSGGWLSCIGVNILGREPRS